MGYCNFEIMYAQLIYKFTYNFCIFHFFLNEFFYQAVVLEGKYWKRKLAAVTAEYKKWRMFYRNKILGWTNKDGTDIVRFFSPEKIQ